MANKKLDNADKFYIDHNPGVPASKLAKDLGHNISTIQKYREKMQREKIANASGREEKTIAKEEAELTEKVEIQEKLGRNTGVEKSASGQAHSLTKTAALIADEIFQGADRTPNPSYIRSHTEHDVSENMKKWRNERGL